jgi:hypothetical protein
MRINYQVMIAYENKMLLTTNKMNYKELQTNKNFADDTKRGNARPDRLEDTRELAVAYYRLPSQFYLTIWKRNGNFSRITRRGKIHTELKDVLKGRPKRPPSLPQTRHQDTTTYRYAPLLSHLTTVEPTKMSIPATNNSENTQTTVQAQPTASQPQTPTIKPNPPIRSLLLLSPDSSASETKIFALEYAAKITHCFECKERATCPRIQQDSRNAKRRHC